MKTVYDTTELFNLHVVKEARHWCSEGFITKENLAAIQSKYPSKLYHPNLAIRILLFVATFIAVCGAAGLVFIMLDGNSQAGVGVFMIVFGVGSFFLAEKVFIEKNNHFRSGVAEAVAYSACGFLIFGIGLLTDENEHVLLITGVAVLAYMSIRFLDLLCHIFCIATLGGLIFYECYQLGGIFQQIIPFVIIVSFSAIYWLARRLRKNEASWVWDDNLRLTEFLSLLIIYAGGNYLVVRECSIEMLDLHLEPGQDIPLAFFFYAFTAISPLVLLYRGVMVRSIGLIRIGVVTLALSILTFRYYFSITPPEVALTVAGLIVLGVAAWLFNYLKIDRFGFTREKLLSRQWVSNEVTAFAVSQTMGGNVTKPDESFKGGGGSFGGGGASGDF
jgi:uncharacterized membrane protein YgcG